MAIVLYDCLPINNIYRPKNRILFWSEQQDHGRFVYRKLNGRQKVLRQHAASADKKEYFDGTFVWYWFMKLICEISSNKHP